MTDRAVRLGLRENRAQFTLLVAVNAFVGAMVGLERSTLPLIGRDDFDVTSKAGVLSFIVAFGLAKALTNLGAGGFAARLGRRRLLIAGWAVALPVPLLIAVAPSWGWIVAANVLLGINQGLAWSMTVVMKIDLVGPRRRGLALGLNEAAGYVGVAIAAAASGWLAAEYAARDVLVVAAATIAIVALLTSILFVRDTAAHVALEQAGRDDAHKPAPTLREAFPQASWRIPALRACSQAGLVNNLNDALAWGLIPLFLAAHGAGAGEIGLVAATYPAVWGVTQIATGHWSDRIGRKLPIITGMLTQAVALAALALSDGDVATAVISAVVLGLGTALVYPTLIAAVSDAVSPVARAPMVGIYRFWRDMGYVAGGLIAGTVADAIGFSGAIAVVAALTAISGLWVAWDLPGRTTPAAGSSLSRRANIELLFFDGCPGHEALLPRLREIAERAGAQLEIRRVETPQSAQTERFLGSPTVRVNGRDVDPSAPDRDDYGLKCRLYPLEGRLSPTPPEAWISAALARTGPGDHEAGSAPRRAPRYRP